MSFLTLPKVPCPKGGTKIDLPSKQKMCQSLPQITVTKQGLPQDRSDSNSPL